MCAVSALPPLKVHLINLINIMCLDIEIRFVFTLAVMLLAFCLMYTVYIIFLLFNTTFSPYLGPQKGNTEIQSNISVAQEITGLHP